ncbi:MAG: 5-oxoprolinase subunit PxpB [Desulfohalobiaceae bacterium]|nr:5-oxoprolinase subunit PxpB [Desulfohalobiaceae bacterium]
MENTIYKEPLFRVVGDRGLLVEYGDSIDPVLNRKVRTVAELCRTDPPPGLIEVIPAYRSLQLIYDPLLSNPPSLEAHLRSLEDRLDSVSPPPARTVDIPVCYGHEFGPDLPLVAEHNSLSQEEAVRLHSQAEYLIYMLGFTPGFPFLGGLDKRLHTPRRETPRTRVPEGSVGIANGQTGIYPLSSPGGWQLIGRTPLRLFDPAREEPVFYKPGDSLRFTPISREEYRQRTEGGDHD